MSIKTKPFFAVSIVAFGLSLGGCQMLGLGGSMASASTEQMRTGISADFGAQQLEEGRRALVEGRTADAIGSFMLARTFPEQSAAAFNGLAVSYSRLGRTDLAERFFQTAIAMAPSEERFRTNLAVFYSRNGSLRQSAPEMALAPVEQAPLAAPVAVVAEAPRPVRALGGGLTVQSPPAHVQRVSLNEVRVSGPATRSASAASRGGHRAVINVGASQAQEYPIRITLADAPPRRGRSGYPVRVDLDH